MNASAPPTGRASSRRRLSPESREEQILQAAISFFARRGFEASTRELAAEIGITQPLLYRYFSTKEALVDKVFEEVFLRRWNPEWEEWLADRGVPLADRLKRYLNDYASFVLKGEWIRIFIHAGLSRSGINQKFIARLRERHFLVIARELRAEYAIPEPPDEAAVEDEVDLIWAMHASVFYIGVRRWVYELPVPKDLDRVIGLRVDAFLAGVPEVLRRSRMRRDVDPGTTEPPLAPRPPPRRMAR